MNVFLIRHAKAFRREIFANGDNYNRTIDSLVELMEVGLEQACNTGKWLSEYCAENEVCLERAKVWVSPFTRTRQTFKEFNSTLQITNVAEHVSLIEQQFGFLSDELCLELFPKAYTDYVRQQQVCNFYAKFPMGESPWDVAIRIQQMIDTINHEYEKGGIETFFIFTHAIALKAFLLKWFNYSPEWFHKEFPPKNCQIRRINKAKDYGYINL